MRSILKMGCTRLMTGTRPHKPKPMPASAKLEPKKAIMVDMAQAYRETWKRLYESAHPALRDAVDNDKESRMATEFAKRVIKETEEGVEK